MKSFIEENLSSIVFGVIVLLVGGFFGWRFISRHQREKVETIQMKQKISNLVEHYNAVTNWQHGFDEDGIKIGEEHRAVYTTDIESALIRSDDRPVLIVGYVFEVRKIDDRHYLGIKAFGYPDMNFILECQSKHAERVLAQATDEGESFAVVASVVSVSRPTFEADAWIEGTDDDRDAQVIVEPGDVYLLQGRCLDISYVGHYE
jgi:hypothetical protein